MKRFTYYNPVKYIFGKGTIEKIGSELESFGVKKVLMLYGGGSIFRNGVYEQTINSLRNASIDFIELGGVKPNPVMSKVYEAIQLCRTENVDGILAVGGGSVLDSAKVIASGMFFDGDIWDVFEGKRKPPEKALPVFSILTISATGSENNAFAVVTNEKENKKWAFSAGNVSFPKVAVIDPAVQFSLPREQTVYGSIDMMAHVFEFYFAHKEESIISDEIFEGILRTIIGSVKTLLDEPTNYSKREDLALAGTLALSGLYEAGLGGGDWASHAIEHSLSAFYDIAHGAGLAIIFPAWMKFVYRDNLDKFVRYAKNIWGIEEADKEKAALQGILKTEEFFQSLGAPVLLSDVKIPVSDIEKIARNAALTAPLGLLRKLGFDDIVEILKIAGGEAK